MKKKMEYALKNFFLHKVQTIGFITALALFSSSLFFGLSVKKSLGQGIEDTSERIGARMMLIPSSAVSDYESMLLQATPSAFYLDRSVTEILDREGITYSPQIYLKTLKASCCTAPLQVIGYDTEKDFTLAPWIDKDSGQDGVTVGYGVGCGETILLFGTEYPVKQRLKQTGSGYDHSVYVPMKYISHMFDDSIGMGAEYYIDDINTVYSVIMIKDECELPDIGNVTVVKNSGLVSDMEDTLSGLTLIIGVFLVLMGIATESAVLIMTKLNTEAMRKEIGTYRVLGIDRYTVLAVFLSENVFTGLIGTVAGTSIGMVFITFYGQFLSQSFSLPYIKEGFAGLLGTGIWSFTIPFIPYILTASLSVWKICKSVSN